MRVLKVLRPHLAAALGALLLALALPVVAGAAKPPKPPKPPTAACPATGAITQVFLPQFGDPAFYYLAPGGSFESGAWTGGKSMPGNEPAFVTSAADKKSMTLSSAATSPVTCITADAPTIRFFARRSAGPALSSLGVTALVPTTAGEVALPLATTGVPLSGGWSVTLPTPILANLTAPLSTTGTVDGRPAAPVRFVLTPSAGSTWQVDDFYVDPYSRN